MLQHQILDLPQIIFFNKILKAAKLAMTNSVFLNGMKTEFLPNNTQKKQQAKHTKVQYIFRNARVFESGGY